MYEVEGGLVGKFAVLEEFDVYNMGQLSPSHIITLNEEDAQKAGIPGNAYSFVWAYPLANVGILTDERKAKLATLDADMCFLVFGGYIYFDISGNIVQANAVAQGNALYFSERQWWRPEFTTYLARQGRFQEITIQQMRDQGARHFCWVRPSEQLEAGSGKNKEIWTFPSELGAFVYLFHDDPNVSSAQDCFFSIVDSSSIQQQTPATSTSHPVAELSRPSTYISVEPFSVARKNKDNLEVAHLTECIVCMDAPRQIIFGPCSHFIACQECATILLACPTCKAPIHTKTAVFT